MSIFISVNHLETWESKYVSNRSKSSWCYLGLYYGFVSFRNIFWSCLGVPLGCALSSWILGWSFPKFQLQNFHMSRGPVEVNRLMFLQVLLDMYQCTKIPFPAVVVAFPSGQVFVDVWYCGPQHITLFVGIGLMFSLNQLVLFFHCWWIALDCWLISPLFLLRPAVCACSSPL